jgi:propanediol dehydratase small subunit
MQIQQQIMAELADIPEDKLAELYELIHYFKLGLITEKKQPLIKTTANDKEQRYQAIKKICDDYAGLPVLDTRSADEILGYDKSPIGLWGDE